MFQPPTAVRAAWEKPPDPRCGTRADLFDALQALAQDENAAPRVLLVADVDGFRAFNARHGYEAGDVALRSLGRAAVGIAPAFRVGSDAFALLLEGDAAPLTEKVGQALDLLMIRYPERLHCSFGVTMIPVETSGAAALALAEERLEDQRRRGLVFPDRVVELLLTLMEAYDSTLSKHARDVARLADAVAARLGLSVAERGLVKRTAELFIRRNGCKDHEDQILPSRSSFDATMTTRMTWSSCQSGKSVTLYKVDGGGHQISGERAFLPRMLGQSSRDFRAADEIVKMFAREERGDAQL